MDITAPNQAIASESLLSAIQRAISTALSALKNADDEHAIETWAGMTDHTVGELIELHTQYIDRAAFKWPLPAKYSSFEGEQELGGRLSVLVDETHTLMVLQAFDSGRLINTIMAYSAPLPILSFALRIIKAECGLSIDELSRRVRMYPFFLYFLIYVYEPPAFDKNDKKIVEMISNVSKNLRKLEFYRLKSGRDYLTIDDLLSNPDEIFENLSSSEKKAKDAADIAFRPLADASVALREERERQGLTQAQVAERMGLKERTVRQIESGSNAPTVTTIERYAAALGFRPTLKLEPAEPT